MENKKPYYYHVKDLSPELQELTLLRYNEQHNSEVVLSSIRHLSPNDLLNWRNTPEGRDFWYHVHYNGVAPKGHQLASKKDDYSIY